MNSCGWKPSQVTLHDGRVVMSDSEEWRHECEAMTVIRMPGQSARRAYLRGTLDNNGVLRGGVFGKRGEAATRHLEDTIKKIWYSQRNSV